MVIQLVQTRRQREHGGKVHGTCNGKAEQLERDFGIPHPTTVMNGGLRRHDDRDIEPLTISVARDRIAELTGRGFSGADGLVVLFMRGARREVLSRATGIEVEALVKKVRARIRQGTLDTHIAESQRGLDLWRRA